MKEMDQDGGLHLFKGASDETKLRVFETETRTRRQEMWHQTLRCLCNSRWFLAISLLVTGLLLR